MPRGDNVTNVRNVVQQTSDYDQFSFIESNRDQSRGHVEALKRAYEEMGNFTKVQPILVNDRYQIIDGQHRFTACKELGLPIFFTVVAGLGVKEARNMNLLHRSWRVDDFAHSYATDGDPNYIKYIQLKEDYGFSHSILMAYITGHADRSGTLKDFREGNLVVEDEAGVRSRLDKLAGVGEYTNLVNNREFGYAMLKAMNVEDYDQKRMVKKVRLHGDAVLKRLGAVDDNLRQLEEVYNYGMRGDNRVRLF